MKLTLIEATQIIQEDFDPEVFTQIADQCVDMSGRWYNTFECVFTAASEPGKFFMLRYQRGATESQYYEPEDMFGAYGEDSIVEAIEVKPVEKTIITYVTVK